MRSVRSGWCGIGAVGWQHARCKVDLDVGVRCSCGCHAVAGMLERHDLAGLAVDVDGLVAAGGVVPPAVVRLRAALHELLGVDGGSVA